MIERRALAVTVALSLCAVSLCDAARVLERGPHHRKIENVTAHRRPDGTPTLRTNSLVVLETGTHYKGENGEWLDSQEVIEPHPSGAIAQRGPHTVLFAANLNTYGAIRATLPDGKVLTSHVVAIGYTDASTGTRVTLGTVKDSQGNIIEPNTVRYFDAFDGVLADVEYVWRKSGYEQNVVLWADVLPPESFGLNPDTTTLDVWTEFPNSPSPTKKIRELRELPDAVSQQGIGFPATTDVDLGFGAARILPGRAFSSAHAPRGKLDSAHVFKQWTVVDGRTFLIESANYRKVKVDLPLSAAVGVASNKTDKLAFNLPKPPKVGAEIARPMLMASLDRPSGFVVDYSVTLPSYSEFTFENGVTYVVSNTCVIAGQTVFEGGSTLKFPDKSDSVLWPDGGAVSRWSTETHPTVFTSVHDNSVGEPISGSSGQPTIRSNETSYIQFWDQGCDLKNIRVRYANVGLYFINAETATNHISNAQFVHCKSAMFHQFTSFKWANVLGYDLDQVLDGGSSVGTMEHVTLSKAGKLADGFTLYATNSLFVNVTNFGTATLSTNTSHIVSGDPTNTFQAVGAGYHYLKPGSTLRDAGTTNVSATALASVRAGTTYPPTVSTNPITLDTTWTKAVARDTTLPDIGYHYPVIDYAVNTTMISNATLRVNQGVTIATAASVGLWLPENAVLCVEGTPDDLVRFTVSVRGSATMRVWRWAADWPDEFDTSPAHATNT